MTSLPHHPTPASHILVLGGTADGRELAARLRTQGYGRITLSLAGRTQNVRDGGGQAAGVATRVGGFGGAEGLADYMRAEGVTALIDATHPFAAQMSINAARAARLTGVPACVLSRAPWRAMSGDDWREVDDMAAAVIALGAAPQRVFLAIGRQQLAPFMAAPQHSYVTRSIEPPPAEFAPPRATVILARGPFAEADEIALMRDHAIDVIVAKNAGGDATYGKLAAARALGLPVIMVRRPPATDLPVFVNAEDVLAWLAGGSHGLVSPASGSAGALRGE